ncbi:flagellin [Sphingobium sufflavum]|jgi:flagellar hook-associated protein 3 FlgL|uniref:flagellin n=1 Tax=Sphingobium sufflavum TaxID=1129547 RepID=UPI001F2B3900|nr:flagellin [Sphingobium sufflavum]MCE7797338.1 flagellin [Sphingobium sufflavum]
MVFITNQSVNAEIKRQQKLANDIANYQQQISTGVKFDKPSDNPQDWIQISYVGRQQSLNGAWQSNVTFAQSRSAQATSSLDDVSNLMTKVKEALISSTSQAPGSPGVESTALVLQGIRENITNILNQKDYQGTPVFDDGNTSVTIPVGKGLAYEAVGTRKSIEEGIVTDSGTKTIYDILDAAIAAVRASDSAGISKSLGEANAALDHVIVQGTRQGVRETRLGNEVERLQTANLQLAERRSNLEDTDLTEVITRVQAKLTSLQAAQAAFAKINQQSLFDLLR